MIEGSGLVGLAVSRKHGGKPDRNLIKRRWREGLMSQRSRITKWDLVWTIGLEATDWTLERIQEQADQLLKQVEEAWGERSESF